MVKTSSVLLAAGIALGFVYLGGIGLTRRAVVETKDAVEDFRGGLETIAEKTAKDNSANGEMTSKNG